MNARQPAAVVGVGIRPLKGKQCRPLSLTSPPVRPVRCSSLRRRRTCGQDRRCWAEPCNCSPARLRLDRGNCGAPVRPSPGDSFRPLVNQYYYVAAATQQAIVVATDMGAANTPTINQLISMNGVCASGSTTSEQKIFSFKTPPLFLPLNFKMTFIGAVNLTNGAGTKVLNCRMNGVGGTSFFTSPALASNANYNFVASLCGDGTGNSCAALGLARRVAWGTGGATAYTTLTRDYINNETEFVLTATKGTAGDIV